MGKRGCSTCGSAPNVFCQRCLRTGSRAAKALVTRSERGLRIKLEQSTRVRGLGGFLCCFTVIAGSPRVGSGFGGGSVLPGMGLGVCCGFQTMPRSCCSFERRVSSVSWEVLSCW